MRENILFMEDAKTEQVQYEKVHISRVLASLESRSVF